jgi:probable rRNA maturation factor
MAAAHLKYSGIAGTTDVLTFDLRDDSAAGDPLDVDLWICIDEARRNAADRGLPVERELLLYILHGMLHCLGHDDHDEAAHLAMHTEEDRVLMAIGVGATFGVPAAGEPRGGTA